MNLKKLDFSDLRKIILSLLLWFFAFFFLLKKTDTQLWQLGVFLVLGEIAININEFEKLVVGREKIEVIKKIKNDIYAKADELKSLVENMTQLTTLNLLGVGRFASDDLDKQLLEARETIVSILDQFSSNTKLKTTLVDKINNTVRGDLEQIVLSAINRQINDIHQTTKKSSSEISRDLKIKLQKYKGETGELNEIKKFIKESGLPITTEIAKALKDFEKFIRTKRI